jgi:hypothetical protein
VASKHALRPKALAPGVSLLLHAAWGLRPAQGQQFLPAHHCRQLLSEHFLMRGNAPECTGLAFYVEHGWMILTGGRRGSRRSMSRRHASQQLPLTHHAAI